MLEVYRFKDGFDHEIASLQIRVVVGGVDAAERLITGGRIDLFARYAFVELLLGVGLALFGGLQTDVLENDVDSGGSRDVRDPGAHHARADHGQLGRLRGFETVGTRTARVDRIQVEEERLGHVFELLSDHEVDQIARFDAAGGLEWNLGSFDRRAHNIVLRSVRRPLEFFAQVRGEGRQRLGQFRAAGGASGDLVVLAVPRLGGRTGIALYRIDPRFGGAHQLVLACHQLVDQAELLGLGRTVLLALQQMFHERVLQAELAYKAGDASPAGKQAQGGLGQAELVPTVDGDTVVARQRDFQATAQRGAVNSRHHRFAAGFQLAQRGLHGLDVLEQRVGVYGFGLHHQMQIAAGEEGLFGAGHDDAAHRRGIVLDLGQQTVDGPLHGVLVRLIHGVGVLARVVHDQMDDAVG